MGQSVAKYLKEFDYFGVQYNFSYGSKEKYRTATGGIFFILFIVISISYSLVSLIPLMKREKMSVIYYTMQLSETDKINFHNHSNNFALGVSSCLMLKNISEFWDYFKLELTHTSYEKGADFETQVFTPIPFGKCNYSDFGEEFSESFEGLGLNSYYCMKNNNFTIEGTSISDAFKFITIKLKAINNRRETFEKIKEILKDECEFNMYVIDAAFDLSNYTNPVQKFLASQTLNLRFTETMKRNAFYQLHYFKSYEDYFFDIYKKQQISGAGSVDLYSVFKDEDRLETGLSDFNTFAKIYVKADLQRKIIERRYMKLTEFGADISSVLSAILIVMFVLVSFINKFYANEAVMRKIFQFNSKYENISVRFKNSSKLNSGEGLIQIIKQGNFFKFEEGGNVETNENEKEKEK